MIPFRPSFRNVGERSQGWLPSSPTGPHYESQRAAPPRASAAEAVPAGSWSPQRPRRSLTPTGRGSRPPARGPPNRPGAGPRSPPRGASSRGRGRGGALGLLVLSVPSPRLSPVSPLGAVVGQSDFNWGKLSWGLCPLPFLKYRDHYSLKVLGWNLIRALSARNFFEVENRTPEK